MEDAEIQFNLGDLLKQHREEQEWQEISRGRFMIGIDQNIQDCARQLRETQERLYDLLGTQESVLDFEEHGFRVTYLQDQHGNLMYEAEEKKPMGFVYE